MSTVPPRKLATEIAIAAAILALLTGVIYLAFTSAVYKAKWDVVWDYRIALTKGFGITILVSVLALLLSVILAVLLVVGQKAGSVVLRQACKTYIELIRGTPLLVQIYVAYFMIAPGFGLDRPLPVGIIALAAFSAAYLAEIMRGGLESIADSQLEASTAVGFTTGQTYRYIIVPQAVRRILPGVAGEFANLIKNSCLLSYIGVSEVFKQAADLNANNYVSFEAYVPLAVAYLLLTIPIALVSRTMESRYAFKS